MSDELKQWLDDESKLLMDRYINTGSDKFLQLAGEIQALIERLCDD